MKSTPFIYTGAMLMALSIVGYLTLFILSMATSNNYKYSIAIDSGSTHSQVTLFRWKADKLNETGLVEQIRSCNVHPGISSFVDEKLDKVADGLIYCVKNLNEYVDNKDLLIYLGATAGMRMLNLSEPDKATRIIEVIKSKFNLAGLNLKKITIITGKEEGLFAWVSANYLSGSLFRNLNNSSNKSYGILDMGGASVQIAYPIKNTFNNEKRTDYTQIELFGKSYYVNAFSNLCFGAQQALYRYLKLIISNHQLRTPQLIHIEVPCFPIGFESKISAFKEFDNICTKFLQETNNSHINPSKLYKYKLIGTGQIKECKEYIDQLMNIGQCQRTFQICSKTLDTNNNNNDNNKFYAMSAFYHLTKVLNFNKTENISRNQYLNKSDEICSMSVEQLNNELGIPKKYTTDICFKLTYIISTLTNLFKFTDQTWPQLKFVNRIENNHIGWITGLMINETNLVPSEIGKKPLIEFNTKVYLIMIVLLIVFILGAIISKNWKNNIIQNIV